MEYTGSNVIEYFAAFSSLFVAVIIFFIFLNTQINPLNKMFFLTLGIGIILLLSYGIKLLLGNIDYFKNSKKVICNIFSISNSVLPDFNIVFLVYLFTYFIFSMLHYDNLNGMVLYFLLFSISLYIVFTLMHKCQTMLFVVISIGIGIFGGYSWYEIVRRIFGDDYMYFSKNKDGSTTNCVMISNKYKCFDEKNGGLLLGF
jgi:hypothetical protein|tara:strand:+ start:6767 stop:7369 length:603 start_codon:yes stop_codon:yes gene_type:complete